MKIVKTLINECVSFIQNAFGLFLFALNMINQRSFKNCIKKVNRNCIYVLANGPSLKESLNKIIEDGGYETIDFIAMNYLGNTDYFQTIKPKYYCFADPIFWQESPRTEESKQLFERFNNITWRMTIFVPSVVKSKFVKFAGLKNSNIDIIGVNTTLYSGFECLKNWFYKKGLAMPQSQTVAIQTIYAAIMLGYKEIRLFGVDHSYTTSLCVNERNQVCRRYEHFYASKEGEMQPIGEGVDMVSFFKQGLIVFSGHKQLANFANYMGTRILNCTKGSFIDVYERSE